MKFLWLQEVVRDRRLEVRKVHGTDNPADVLTKPKSASEVVVVLPARHMNLIARAKTAHRQTVSVLLGSIQDGAIIVRRVVA